MYWSQKIKLAVLIWLLFMVNEYKDEGSFLGFVIVILYALSDIVGGWHISNLTGISYYLAGMAQWCCFSIPVLPVLGLSTYFIPSLTVALVLLSSKEQVVFFHHVYPFGCCPKKACLLILNSIINRLRADDEVTHRDLSAIFAPVYISSSL